VIPELDPKDFDPDGIISAEQLATIASAIESFESARLNDLLKGASKSYADGSKIAAKLMKKKFVADEIEDDLLKFLIEYQKQLRAGYTVIQGKKVYWLRDRVLSERQFIFDTISNGIIEGRSIEKTAKELQEYFKTSKKYSMLLARTETMYVRANARDERYKKNGVKKVKWLLGKNPCEICQPLGGKIFTWDNLPYNQPVHVRCTCGLSPQSDDAVVSEPIKAPVKEPKTPREPVKTEPKVKPKKEPIQKKEPKTKPMKEEPIRTHEEVEKVIREKEKSIKDLEKENAVLFDRNGNLIFEQDGDEDHVSFTPSQLEQMKGNILTHNHPINVSFSDADVRLACKYEMNEVRAVSSTRSFSLKFSDGRDFTPDDWMKIDGEWQKNYQMGKIRYADAFKNNEISKERYDYLVRNHIWSHTSKKIDGLKYIVSVIK